MVDDHGNHLRRRPIHIPVVDNPVAAAAVDILVEEEVAVAVEAVAVDTLVVEEVAVVVAVVDILEAVVKSDLVAVLLRHYFLHYHCYDLQSQE